MKKKVKVLLSTKIVEECIEIFLDEEESFYFDGDLADDVVSDIGIFDREVDFDEIGFFVLEDDLNWEVFVEV